MSQAVPASRAESLMARRGEIADSWYRAIAPTGFSPEPSGEIRRHLEELVVRLVTVLFADVADWEGARSAGRALVGLHYLHSETIGRTEEVLARELAEGLAPAELAALHPRLARLLSEVAVGFVEQAQEAALADQEQIREALLAEHARVERELRASEASLAEAQRIAHLGHWTWDIAGDRIGWSDEIYRIFGTSRSEFDGTLESFRRYVHPEDRDAVDRSVREAFPGGRFEFEHRIVRPSGEVRIVHQSGEIVRDTGGRPARVVGTVHDVTERKVLEEHRYMQRFLAMVSHDLRQPLSILLGRVGLLIGQAPSSLGDNEVRSLRAIEAAAQRIERLVDDIEDAVHIGAHHFEVQPTRLDLVEVLHETVEHQRSTASYHHITLTAPERVEGSWDRDRLGQLFANLLSNAVKYSPDGGEVRVMVRATGREVVVEVSDQGIGIPAESRHMLFEPFARLGIRGSRGKGLGLYISRAIAEAHGGRIWFESEEGKGSSFYVSLPIAP